MSDTVDVQDCRRHEFFIVDNAVILRHGKALGPYGIAVYNALAMHAGKEGRCNPSVLTIAGEIGACKRRVQEAMRVIADLGLMSIVPPPRGVKATNVYLLTPVVSAPEPNTRTECMGACGACVNGCTECMGAPHADEQELRQEHKPSFANAQDGFAPATKAPALVRPKRTRPPQAPKPLFDAYCKAWRLPPNGGRHASLAGEFDRDASAAGATVAEFDAWVADKRASREWGKFVRPHSTTTAFLAARDNGEIGGGSGQSIDPVTGKRVIVWESLR